MANTRKTNNWFLFAMVVVVGLIVGFFGDTMEKWVESFSFVAEDGWISSLFPGVVAGLIGGLGFGAIYLFASKRNTRTHE